MFITTIIITQIPNIISLSEVGMDQLFCH